MKKSAYSKRKDREPRILWTGPPFMAKRVNDRVEKENGMLGKMVSDLREKPINPAEARKMFVETYLKKPLLKRRGRKTSTGWENVLKELKIVVVKHSLSKIQSEVTLGYVPLKKGTPVERDIDLKAHVRTTLVFSSEGITAEIDGDLFHRRPCPLDP